MRIVAALGGNALLERGEAPDADVQVGHIDAAVLRLAPVARHHELIVTHGNGPQVGLLALESARDSQLRRPYPFDVLDAQTQGMIGYWLLQGFENFLPGRLIAGLITQTLVSSDDPAFANPTKFVGPIYSKAEADRRSSAGGWTVRPDGRHWRRVVPSPAPVRIVETPIIRHLVDAGAVVVCSGGGGIPVVRNQRGQLEGIEAVVDKDASAALLAETLDADLLLLLTDVRAVMTDFGTRDARPVTRATPARLRSMQFPAGSMGPKVDAACRFVERTGAAAAIGGLRDVEAILAGRDGTIVSPDGHLPAGIAVSLTEV